MRAVFISYRREDTEGQAGRLASQLEELLGKESVFMDVDSIDLGRDFREVLQDRLSSCDMMLALIGPGWLNAKDAAGNRRLESPTDFVRQEIAAALKRNIPVTPVLVTGARMPAQESLPEDIAGLAFRNGFELSHSKWESDFREMVRRLGLGQREHSHATKSAMSLPAAQKAGGLKKKAIIVAGAALAVLVLLLIIFGRRSTAPTTTVGSVSGSTAPTMSESPKTDVLMQGMTYPAPGSDGVELITNEKLVGEKYGIINDKPWRRKALVASDESHRAFYQPRVAIMGQQIYVLYLAKSDEENEIYFYELALGSPASKLIDRVPYASGTGYYFDSESNLKIDGQFVYYYGTKGMQGRRYKIGSGEKAEPTDFYPRTDEGSEPVTSISPNGRYIVASIAGGLWENASEDYKLATRGQKESGQFAGISLYDRKTNSNDVLFKQEYTGDWSIGRIIWADDSENLFFDNAGAVACVWKYALKSRILQKIVPEHEARAPVFFRFDGREYIVYVDSTMNSQVMIATE